MIYSLSELKLFRNRKKVFINTILFYIDSSLLYYDADTIREKYLDQDIDKIKIKFFQFKVRYERELIGTTVVDKKLGVLYPKSDKFNLWFFLFEDCDNINHELSERLTTIYTHFHDMPNIWKNYFESIFEEILDK